MKKNMRRRGKKKIEKPSLWDTLKAHFEALSEKEEVLSHDLPKKWEKHGDLILLPPNCFTRPEWSELDQTDLWERVADYFKVSRVAKKDRICDDGHRTPQVVFLKGADPWVCHVDNKIKYFYDVTKCMFSIGNITEKIRMAKLNCEGETIVDMFAGIGYFTLPLLVHGKALHVHACEWNKDAVVALKKNLIENKVNERCTVYEGDNREVCPENVADRVIMGLIPTPMGSMLTACKSLKHGKGGILHVHHNVESNIGNNNDKMNQTNPNEEVSCNKSHILPEWNTFAYKIAETVRNCMLQAYAEICLNCEVSTQLLHIEKVKSYAPHIDHLVFDLKVIVSMMEVDVNEV